MPQEPPPDNVRSLVEQLQRTLDWAVELFLSGNWSTLLLLFVAALVAIGIPGEGLAYKSLKTLLDQYYPQYPVLFWIVVALSIILSATLKLFNLNKPVPHRALAFAGYMVMAITFIFVARIISSPPDTDTFPTGDKFSWGEEFLMPGDPQCKNFKDNATAMYGNEKGKGKGYAAAEKYYTQYVNTCKNAPEARIYLSNTIAMQANDPMRIAVSVPISRNDKNKQEGFATSAEILRGVGIAQNEWNEKNKDRKLLIGIADDGWGNGDSKCGDDHNRGECRKAREVAEFLAKQKNILSVIGPLSSDATEAAAKVYEKEKLVAISPTSTAIRDNSNQCQKDKAVCLNPYIFRTAPNDEIAVLKLIDMIPEEIKKVSIVYEGSSKYSRGFKAMFTREFEDRQGKDAIVNQKLDDLENNCNFSMSRGFKASNCLESSKEADAFLLLPSGRNKDSVKEILDLNSQSPHRLDLLGGDGMYNEIFIKGSNMEEKSNGLKVVVPWQRNDDRCDPGNTRLECKAEKLFNVLEISWRTATAYDATQALLEGLKQAVDQKCSFGIFGFRAFNRGDRCLREELKDELRKIGTSGVLGDGRVRFNDQYDRAYDNSLGVIVEAQKGKFQLYKEKKSHSLDQR